MFKEPPPPRSRFVFTVIIYGCSGESDMENLTKGSDDDILYLEMCLMILSCHKMGKCLLLTFVNAH